MHCRQQERNAGMTLGQSPKLLTPHPSFTGDLGWAEAPIQPPGLSCCSNKFFQGVALGGWQCWPHSAPQLVGKCDSCKSRCPARQQSARRRNQSSPLCARAASWGTRTAPQGPGHASTETQHRLPRVGIFSGSLPPPQPGAGGGSEDAPFGRNLTSFPGRDQLIHYPPRHPPPASFLPGLCKLSPLWGWGRGCDMEPHLQEVGS